MSSIVCQGLQSCLEPWLVEPGALGLKLASPTPHLSRSLVFARNPCGSDSDTDKLKEKCYSDTENNNNMDDSKNNNIPRIGSSNGDLGGNWNFIKALTNTKEEAKEKESFYVHPLVKRSSSKLSEKSLELCTESLGSETGTDMSENSDIDISSSCSSDSESCVGGVTVKSINISKALQPQFGQQVSISSRKVSNNNNNSHKFPPPLTSISGSNCVHVRTHREGGRLVIKAVTVPTPHTYFQAERSDGRLTLRFLKNQSHHIDCEAAKEGKERTNYVKDEEENQDEEHEEEEEEEEEEEDYEEDEDEEDDDNEEEEEEIENKERSDVYFGEEINVNDKGEMGIRKFRRPSSRCNTGAFLGGGYLKPCFGRSLAVAEM